MSLAIDPWLSVAHLENLFYFSYYFLKIFQESQKEIVGLFVNVGESRALLRYLDDIVETLRDDKNVKKRIKNDRLPAVSFKDVDFGYDDKKMILEEFNMNIFKGHQNPSQTFWAKLIWVIHIKEIAFYDFQHQTSQLHLIGSIPCNFIIVQLNKVSVKLHQQV